MLNERLQLLIKRSTNAIDNNKLLVHKLTGIESERDAMRTLMSREKQRSVDMETLLHSSRVLHGNNGNNNNNTNTNGNNNYSNQSHDSSKSVSARSSVEKGQESSLNVNATSGTNTNTTSTNSIHSENNENTL